MLIQREDHNQVTLLKLHGEMGSHDVEHLKKMILDLVKEKRVYIVLDMEQVDFIGSQAILILLRLNREVLASGGSIKLLRPGNVVRRFMSIGRVIELFDRYETQVEAFHSFHKKKEQATVHETESSDPLVFAAKKQREVMNKLIDLLTQKGLIEKDVYSQELTRSTMTVLNLFRKDIDIDASTMPPQ